MLIKLSDIHSPISQILAKNGNETLRLLVENHPESEKLDLSKYLYVTDAGLAHLATLRHLKTLNLRGCTWITAEGLKELPRSIVSVTLPNGKEIEGPIFSLPDYLPIMA